MDKIKPISLNVTAKFFDLDQMMHQSRINWDDVVARPDSLLSIGTNAYAGRTEYNNTFTRGEISAIVAPQKNKKSFFAKAVEAAYIGGQATNHFPTMHTHRTKDNYILSFDTEQGKYYASRSMQTVRKMVGTAYPNYCFYSIKAMTDSQRLDMIEHCIKHHQDQGHTIDWITIDGVADLCSNTNDLVASKKVADQIMRWTSHGIHVMCVIHKTFEKNRATGHLGSYLQKKAESVITLANDGEGYNPPILVKQTDSRGAPFDQFHFDLDTYNMIPKQTDGDKNTIDEWL